MSVVGAKIHIIDMPLLLPRLGSLIRHSLIIYSDIKSDLRSSRYSAITYINYDGADDSVYFKIYNLIAISRQ